MKTMNKAMVELANKQLETIENINNWRRIGNETNVSYLMARLEGLTIAMALVAESQS